MLPKLHIKIERTEVFAVNNDAQKLTKKSASADGNLKLKIKTKDCTPNAFCPLLIFKVC